MWEVLIWTAGGWEILADQFATEEDAQSLLESLATHRPEGELGLMVAESDDEEGN